jgi:Uma2 family endonuclease
MSTLAFPPRPRQRDLVYPDSDGKPMSDNTLQFRYIVTIQGGLDAQFADDPNVFVAGDLLWYPVEGEPTIRQAPDVLVAFGRPKGDRGSYKQWEEGGIAPQVVFEIWSPGNRHADDVRKFEFYQRYGVEEYYLYDPEQGWLEGWRRDGGQLHEIPDMQGWVSPRLKIRFELIGRDLNLYHPDGRKFASFVELAKSAEAARAQADKERRDREAAQEKLDRLAAQLRALGVEPEA